MRCRALARNLTGSDGWQWPFVLLLAGHPRLGADTTRPINGTGTRQEKSQM